MLPQVFGLIRDMFEAHEMGKAFGVYGPVMGLSAMLGPIAAGGLISANVFGAGWRMIFLVNVPVGLAALLLGARTLPAGSGAAGSGAAGSGAAGSGSGSGGTRRGRLDLPGAALAGAGMFLLVFPLAQGHSLGWPAWLGAASRLEGGAGGWGGEAGSFGMKGLSGGRPGNGRGANATPSASRWCSTRGQPGRPGSA